MHALYWRCWVSLSTRNNRAGILALMASFNINQNKVRSMLQITSCLDLIYTFTCNRGLETLFEEREGYVSKRLRDQLAQKQKTVTRTFRIRADWENILQEEADRQGVSVNVLVNIILRKYALFDRWARNYNVISLTQRTFHELINEVSTERLGLIGEKSGSSDAENILNLMGLPQNYDSFVQLVSEHFGGSDLAMWFICYRHSHENSDVFHLQHNLGPRWSAYLQKYLLSFLRSFKLDGEAKVYDYAVNLKVSKPRSHL